MADFCNICTLMSAGQLADGKLTNEAVRKILLFGGDININKLFDQYIKNDLEDYSTNSELRLRVGGICEDCGLLRLGVEKENDVIYLVACCHNTSNENNAGKYRIAVINNGELEYQVSEVERYYERL